MRLWFNKIMKLEQFSDFVTEVENILKNYNVKILTDDDDSLEMQVFSNKILFKYNNIIIKVILYQQSRAKKKSNAELHWIFRKS